MDIDTLRVYNVIHKLGITEKEFDAISTELECGEHTGTALMKVTPKFMVWINHDEKHRIEIVPNHTKLSGPGRILFKTFFTFDIPKEIYTLHELAQYRSDDNNPKHLVTTLEGLKDSIMDRLCDKKYIELGYLKDAREYSYSDKDKGEVERNRLVTKQLETLHWLFDTPIRNSTYVARENIPMITKVFQRKNRRLALIQYDRDYNTTRGNAMFGKRWVEHVETKEYRIQVYNPTMPQYNYVSEGRELLWNYDNDEVWIDDDLTGKIPFKELEIINGQKNGFTFLNSKDYGRIQKTVRIKILEESRRTTARDVENKVIDTIDKEFSKGKIVRKGIIFTHDSVSYDSMKLVGKNIKDYIISQRVHLDSEPEFTNIYEGYVDWLLKLSNYKSCSERTAKYYSEFVGSTELKINNVSVRISKDNNLLKVNDRKISKFDIAVVVKNAINYMEQKLYDEYVLSVSQTNLKVQQAVSEGYIAFDISFSGGNNDNFLLKESKTIRISIPLLRERNKNYTIINNVRYPISNTEALFDIDIPPKNFYRSGELNRAIKLLYKAISGITPKIIGELLMDGEKTYKIHYAKIKAEQELKISKSKEFLSHAVKLTKALKVKGGYKVNGMSGVTYTINAETLAVYKGKDYLCIVDVGDYELDIDADALRNDRIAKRLLALSKDTVVAREIYEQGDKVDKHWISLEG